METSQQMMQQQSATQANKSQMPSSYMNNQGGATSAAAGSISIVPRFFFGLKGDVNNNVFFLNDRKDKDENKNDRDRNDNAILYPCGHNIVIYGLDDKSQRYIPGIEGSEGITAMAITDNKQYLAVCEKSNQAICSVYNIQKFLDTSKGKQQNPVYEMTNVKKRRMLSSPEVESNEFVAVSFSQHNEKQIVTLSGKPDWKLIIWLWDKQKCVTYVGLGISPSQSVNQVSFSNLDQSAIIVSGNGVYRYYQIKDNNQLKQIHSHFDKKKDTEVSTNFTCHAWLHDGKFILCTDQGQILLFESNGDFKQIYIQDTKKPQFPIQSVCVFPALGYQGPKDSSQKSGFVVAGDSGQIRVFTKSDTQENRQPYKRVDGEDLMLDPPKPEEELHNMQLYNDVKDKKVNTIALSNKEDMIIFTTSSNQLIKVPINLERPSEDNKYEYLITSFHSRAINGMDYCIKKHILATCSLDKTVRIWQYANNQFTQEVCHKSQSGEEAHSVAMHPSGFHLIVGYSSCIQMMNIFSRSLKEYFSIPIKNCKEIKFSHGGHLFACQRGSLIQVYKFYTAETPNSPASYQFKSHDGFVKNINWIEDDSGFVSSGADNIINLWKFPPVSDLQINQESNKQHYCAPFSDKNVGFTCVNVHKFDGQPAEVYANCNDKTLRRIVDGKEVLKYQETRTFSQMSISHNRRFFVCGIGEESVPGSIQIIKYDPFEKLFEAQAHSKAVTRLLINFDNTYVFSAGEDGMVAFFKINDKDIKIRDKQKDDKLPSIPPVQHIDEILIEKAERDEIQNKIQETREQIEKKNEQNRQSLETEVRENESKKAELERQREDEKAEGERSKIKLTQEKEEVLRQGKDELEHLKMVHEEELRQKKREFDEKTKADQQRYKDLVELKEQQGREFDNHINELCMIQQKAIKEMNQERELEKKLKDDEQRRLQDKIDNMIKKSKKKRKEIEDDAWDKIDRIKDQNKEELALTIDAGMASKGLLTTETGQHREAKQKKEQLETDNKTQIRNLSDLMKQSRERSDQIKDRQAELANREASIKDKEKRIYDLKKKTQELEKFKFVLDYKIKELKRDIGPREDQISNLNKQTSKMNQEVRHYQKVNKNLTLIVEDLRMRQEGLTSEVEKLKEHLEQQEGQKKRFKNDVQDCLNHIADFKKLKKGCIRLYKRYVKEEQKFDRGETDFHRDHTKHRDSLENSVVYLRSLLQKGQNVAKTENNKIMGQNVQLIQELNQLRKDMHDKQVHTRLAKGLHLMNNSQSEMMKDATRTQKEIHLQEIQINELQKAIQIKEEEVEFLRQKRPPMNQRLPPLDNSQQQQQIMMQSQEFEEEEQTHMQATTAVQQQQQQQDVIQQEENQREVTSSSPQKQSSDDVQQQQQQQDVPQQQQPIQKQDPQPVEVSQQQQPEVSQEAQQQQEPTTNSNNEGDAKQDQIKPEDNQNNTQSQVNAADDSQTAQAQQQQDQEPKKEEN